MAGGVRWTGTALAAVCALTACGRDPTPLTECLGAKPVVERIEDVAPPNCSEVLPGAEEAAAS